jgi:hypothetical protein
MQFKRKQMGNGEHSASPPALSEGRLEGGSALAGKPLPFLPPAL